MEPPTQEHGSPNWRAYFVFTVITVTASLFGGCVNRMENRQKHEQILGEIEKVRLEINRERNR